MSERSGESWESQSVWSGVGADVGAFGEKRMADILAAARGYNGGAADDVEWVSSGEEEERDGEGVPGDGVSSLRGSLRAQVADCTELKELAEQWVSGKRAQIFSQLSRGRFALAPPDRASEVDEILFRSTRFVYLTELEKAGGLYEELRDGRVVASVVGRTGLGKSRKLPGMIAQKAQQRVLHLVGDVSLKVEASACAAVYAHVSTMWTTQKEERVVVMTVKEFCGRFFGDNWQDVINCFDTIVLDECDCTEYWYYGVKALFATKLAENISILMLSATSRDGLSLQKAENEPLWRPERMEDIVGSGGFIESALAKDRTMWIVESDSRAAEVAGLLTESGCVVYTLESGASVAAIERVRRALAGDSTRLRMLVAHARFGVAYNLPVERVVTTGLRQYLAKSGDGYVYKAKPLSALEIAQQLGRADRGLTQNTHQGVVLLPKDALASHPQLEETQRLEAFTLLTAMGVRPGKVLKEAVGSVLPNGLTRRLAVVLLNVVGLPLAVTLRFVAEDGGIPSSYGKALQKFSCVYANRALSDLQAPKGTSTWKKVSPLTLVGKTGGVDVSVPFIGEGEIGMMVILVCAIAEGVIAPDEPLVPRDDGYDSGPECVQERRRKFAALKWRPAPVEVVKEVEQVKEKRVDFVMDVPLNRQPGYRGGVSVYGRGELEALSLAVEQARFDESSDSRGRRFVRVPSSPLSPGVDVGGNGGVIRIPKELFEALQLGTELPESLWPVFLRAIAKEGLADSALFNHWGDPWLAVLYTCSNPGAVQFAKMNGAVDTVYYFLSLLWARYVRGMRTAVEQSHHSVGFWRKLVSRFEDYQSVLSRRAEQGDAKIAQSRRFYERLYDIRRGFFLVVREMEANNVYAPAAVAQMQRILPITRSVGNRVVDAMYDGRAVRAPRLRLRTRAESQYGSVWRGDERLVDAPRGERRVRVDGNGWDRVSPSEARSVG